MASSPTTRKSRRRRGVVLSIQGEQKLRGAIAHAEKEDNFGQKLTLEELSDRTGLDPGTVAKVLDCEQGVDRRSLQRFFQAFELELTDSDVCKPEARQAQVQSSLQDKSSFPTAKEDVSPIPSLSRKERLRLIQQLNSLPSNQFDELVFALAPPSGVMSSNVGAMGNRTKELLDWIESPTGPGIEELLELLEGYIALETILEKPVEETAAPLTLLEPQSRSSSNRDIAGTTALVPSQSNQPAVNETSELRKDWTEASDASVFYGRTTELETLKQWMLEDQCRLITLLGMGGMGKTALSVKIAELVQEEFDYLIWRSLREAPPVEKILTDLIKFLSDQQETELEDTVGDSVNRLIHYLQSSRCLLVLDNAESILQEGTRTGQYREGYKGYGTLIQRVGEAQHQSCLIITSREKPKELARLEGRNRPIRSLPLQGLEDNAGQAFLEAEGLDAENSQWRQIFEYYSGNPLALKIAANTIQDLFGGDIKAFLQQGAGVFGDIRDLLEQQFERLPGIGQSVMYWLMINREPTSIDELKDDILEPMSSSNLLETLESLRKRSLVERTDEGFTLQNVVMEFLTERFISRVSEEFLTQKLELFHRHALMKAIAKDYVRETQVRLILRPVGDRIDNLEQQGRELLALIRQHSHWSKGYAGGNLLNLLLSLNAEVIGYDFSHLTIWQADLREACLHQVNLTNSDLDKSNFAQVMGNILAIVYSPNGDLLATTDDHGQIYLWKTPNIIKQRAWDCHEGWIRTVAFNPEQTLVATGGDRTVKIWDVKTGDLVQTLQHHQDWVRSICFLLEGRILASGSDDQTVKLWDLKTNTQLAPLLTHTSRVKTVVCNADQNILASSGDDGIIYLWHVDSNTDDVIQCETLTAIKINRRVHTLTFHPTKPYLLASSSNDGIVRIWDVSTQSCLQEFSSTDNWLRTLSFSPDGQLIASGGDDAQIRIWDISTGACIGKLLGHVSRIWALAFSPDGQTLASGSDNQTLKFWDVTQAQCMKTLQGYTQQVRTLAFHPNQPLLASGGDDKLVRLWSLPHQSSLGGDFKCLKTFSGHKGRVWSVAIHPNGQWIASSSDDKTVRLWHLETRQSWQIKAHEDWIRAVAFGIYPKTNNIILASSSDERTIKLWDIQTRKCIETLEQHADWIRTIAFNPNPNFPLLASGSDDHNVSEGDSSIKLWNLATGQSYTLDATETNGVRSLAFSPDGKLLASGNEERTVRIWDVEKRLSLKDLLHDVGQTWSVAFSPNGDILASASDDNVIRLWNIKTGKTIRKLDILGQGPRAVTFSLDGQLLAAGTVDGRIHLWNTQNYALICRFEILKPYAGTCIEGITNVTKLQELAMLELGAILHKN